MDWRSLLYFSKGEKQSLILLLLLIFTGSAWLVISDLIRKEDVVAQTQPLYVVNPANAPTPVPIDTTYRLASKPPLPVSRPPTPARKYPPRRKPQQSTFARTEKFPAGSVVELNTADTTTLKKVPGIGSSFAGRIVKFRTLLGGFYSVEQLREVYGMDEERYLSLQNWFHADTSFIAKLPVNHLSSEALAKHPYISYKQARIMQQLCRRKGRLDGWIDLRLLEEFTETDRQRLLPYLSFR